MQFVWTLTQSWASLQVSVTEADFSLSADWCEIKTAWVQMADTALSKQALHVC